MSGDVKKGIYLSSSPHFKFSGSTTGIMAIVLVSLLPECIYATVTFGMKAFALIAVSVAACVVFEAAFQKITRQKVCVSNLSACVTGVLLALVVPPATPLWMIILGDLVAIVIAKGLFGGIGSNVFNPALTGRAFLFLSFPATLGASWLDPQLDAVTSATILSGIKSGAQTFTPDMVSQYFFGNRAGCIGETSILLILISFAFLVLTKIIDWRAPLAMTATVAAGTFLSSLAGTGNAAAAGMETLAAMLTGGLLFGATFMVTDYATAPVTKPGRLIFGFGCGLITFLIRRFGGYPEGVMFSILIMNTIAPFLNNVTGRMYGYGKKGHRRPAPRKIVQEFDTTIAKTGEQK